MIHSKFEHADLIALPRAQDGQRETDVIVQIAFRFRDAKVLAEHGGGEVLGARLSVAAGDADDLEAEVAAVVNATAATCATA